MEATERRPAVDEVFGRVMASAVHVILVEPSSDASGWVSDRLRSLELAWSRFLPGSDLSRLAAAEGAWVAVSPDTVALIERMQHGADISAGSFDPTMVRELIDAGYVDRMGTRRSDGSEPTAVRFSIDLPHPASSVAEIEVDRNRSRVRTPRGLALDPGGIGKGLAADLAVAGLLARGTEGALVSIGGDLSMGGRPPAGEGWRVVIDDPHGGDDLAAFVVDAGGVATSSTRSRRWRAAGQYGHHVLDPRTRTCSHTDLAAVTVVARSGWLAEVHATAAILVGAKGVVEYLRGRDLTGLAVTEDGVVLRSGGLALTAMGTPAPRATERW